MIEDCTKGTIAIRYWLQGKQYFTALQAMEFAKEWHTGLRKDGKTPEFLHQIAIANFVRTLKDLREEENAIAVAFLHDTEEDYPVSKVDIENKFGISIASAVNLLSRKTVAGPEKSKEDYYNSLSQHATASIVKGCDRIHNFQSMSGVFTHEKQRKYIAECQEYILPMLKEARRKFPDQEPAYENIKHSLISQIQLINKALKGMDI